MNDKEFEVAMKATNISTSDYIEVKKIELAKSYIGAFLFLSLLVCIVFIAIAMINSTEYISIEKKNGNIYRCPTNTDEKVLKTFFENTK